MPNHFYTTRSWIKKSLNSICYNYKVWIISSIVFVCVACLGICLFKIGYTLFTKPIPNSGPSNFSSFTKKNPQTSSSVYKSSKDNLIINQDDFVPIDNQANIDVNKNYSIIRLLDSNEHQAQCFLGTYTLIRKEAAKFIFKHNKVFPDSRILHVSNVLHIPIKYKILEQEQVHNNIINCNDWIFIQNNYENLNHLKYDSTNTISFKKEKCAQLSKKIVSATSFTPSFAYFKLDTINAKTYMCLRKPGVAYVQTLNINSPGFQIVRLILDSKLK